jgi:hypothetical protein
MFFFCLKIYPSDHPFSSTPSTPVSPPPLNGGSSQSWVTAASVAQPYQNQLHPLVSFLN